MRLRRRQNKNSMFRRLFERFKQCVEGPGRKHVNFVNNINFVLSLCGHKQYFVTDATDIIHTVVGGSVHFDNIQKRAV